MREHGVDQIEGRRQAAGRQVANELEPIRAAGFGGDGILERQAMTSRRMRLPPMRSASHPAQACHATHLDPFDNEDVALMIEAGAVGADEFADREVFARAAAKLLPRIDAGLAELLDDTVALCRSA